MTAAAGEAAGDGNVAALERSDNVAGRSHAFAALKRGYPRMGETPMPRGTGVSPVGLEQSLKNSITRRGALKINCRSGLMPRFRQTIAA